VACPRYAHNTRIDSGTSAAHEAVQ